MALLHVRAELDRWQVTAETSDPLAGIYVDLACVFERLTDLSAEKPNEAPVLRLVVSHTGCNSVGYTQQRAGSEIGH